MSRTLNQLIKEKTINSGRTISGLAKTTGLEERRVGNLLNGNSSKIEASEFWKICKVLNVDPDQFLNEYEAQK